MCRIFKCDNLVYLRLFSEGLVVNQIQDYLNYPDHHKLNKTIRQVSASEFLLVSRWYLSPLVRI